MFYLLVFCNFFAQLLSCDLQRALTHNIWIKHLIGLICFFFLVILLIPSDKKSLTTMWQYTLVGYLLFVLSSRSKMNYTFILLAILFIHENIRLYVDVEKTLTEKDKERYLEYNKYLQYVAVGVIFYGCLMYYLRQKKEFGSSFSNAKFFLGKTSCEGL